MEIQEGEDLVVLQPEELLDVVLHETVQSLPTEGLCQLFGAHRLVMELQVQVVERHKRLGIFQKCKEGRKSTNLQLMEDPLKSKSDRLLAVVRLRGHLVDGLAQQVCEVQDLRAKPE